MSQLIKIISDSPDVTSVNFGFDAYAKSLVEMIINKENQTPFTIGIYGPWGTGKTTLMRSMKQLLEDKTLYQGLKGTRPSKTVWFQAWKYEKEEELLAGLIEEILRTIKREGSFLESLKGEGEKLIAGTHFKKGVATLLKDFLKVNVNDFIKDPAYRSKLGYYDVFQSFFNRLIWSYTRLIPMFHEEAEPDDTKGVLTIFVDDLDRCPEPRIIKVLETIKLFMDKTGCVFVIGAADEIIHKALESQNYSETDAREFMDKMVQVTFNLPPVDDAEFSPYLKDLIPGNTDIQKILPHMKAILHSTHRNIRKFKRFLNDLNLMDGINKNKGTDIEFESLLLWKVLLFQAPDLKGETIQTILMIKSWIEKLMGDGVIDSDGKISDAFLKKEVREVSLHPYLLNDQIVTIFSQIDLTEDKLRQLITIGDAVKSESTKESEDKEILHKTVKKESALDLMVPVAEGLFLFGENKEERMIHTAFEMDVYPVTNGQFKRFVEKKGYGDKAFWSETGWAWREKNKITAPLSFKSKRLKEKDHPVVGVSYYEAEAYANWAEKRLPTEVEWERCARGTHGSIYPWGDSYDKDRCNTKESGIGKTTQVTRYPNGISPIGCYDMTGNVWEWTIRSRNKGEETYTFKGSSWYDSKEYAHCAYRNDSFPSLRDVIIGFRCARTLT